MAYYSALKHAVGADAAPAASSGFGTVIAVAATAGIIWLLVKTSFGAAPARPRKRTYERVPGILGSRRYE